VEVQFLYNSKVIAKVSLNFKKLTKWFVSGGLINFYKNSNGMVDEVPHITHDYMSRVNGLGNSITVL
jgi:hypothetical protein